MDDPSCLPQPAQESIKNASSASAIGVQSVRPTWFEDLAVPKGLHLKRTKGSPNRYMALNWSLKKRCYR